MNMPNDYKPGTHPGVYIVRDILPKLPRQSVAEFARQLNISRGYFYHIISEFNPAPIKVDTALRLGKLTNTHPAMWLQIQLDYDLTLNRELMQKELETLQPIIS